MVMFFRRVPRDPTSKVERQMTKVIKETDWPDVIKTELIQRALVPPRFYGLPKVHIQGCPLRPIVNKINSPTYVVSKYVAGLLKPHIDKSDAFVKNSSALVPVLDVLVLAPTDIWVSLGVVIVH